MKLPKILFLGGKGGVGKTTLAAATASGFARAGQNTLLISTDPAHSLGDLLETDLGDQPLALAAHLWVRELDPEQARQTYLASVKDNIRRFAAPEFLREAERQVDLSGQHPGVMESALFEALCRQLDDADRWDRIVVDTAPTGHTLHLLTLPESMQAWTHALLQRQSAEAASPEGAERWRHARDVLEARQALFSRTRDRFRDGSQTAFILVLNDDRLSVRESVRARQTLETAGVSVPLGLVNRLRRPFAVAREELSRNLAGLPLTGIADQAAAPQGLAGLQPLIDVLQHEQLLPRSR